MVIDASKGVEKQTLKLFEVCRYRNIPVLTFINKMDMPGREPLDLMHEVENVLHIQSYAANWPIGMGKEFRGVVDRAQKHCLFFHKTSIGGAQKAEITIEPLNSAPAQVLEELERRGDRSIRFNQMYIDREGNSIELYDLDGNLRKEVEASSIRTTLPPTFFTVKIGFPLFL